MEICRARFLRSIIMFNPFEYIFHHAVYYTEYRYAVNTEFGYFFKMFRMLRQAMFTDNHEFERFVVMRLEQLRRNKKIPQAKLGEILGAEGTQSPANKWQRILGAKKKPQKLSLEEYMTVAEMLGKDEPIAYLSYLKDVWNSRNNR